MHGKQASKQASKQTNQQEVKAPYMTYSNTPPHAQKSRTRPDKRVWRKPIRVGGWRGGLNPMNKSTRFWPGKRTQKQAEPMPTLVVWLSFSGVRSNPGQKADRDTWGLQQAHMPMLYSPVAQSLPARCMECVGCACGSWILRPREALQKAQLPPSPPPTSPGLRALKSVRDVYRPRP